VVGLDGVEWVFDWLEVCSRLSGFVGGGGGAYRYVEYGVWMIRREERGLFDLNSAE